MPTLAKVAGHVERGGRPSKYTPELHQDIITRLSFGNTRTNAAACAGVSSRTLYDWTTRGKAGEEPFATLLDDMNRVEAECQSRGVSHLQDFIEKGDSQALRFFMERRYKEWRETRKLEVDTYMNAFLDRCQRELSPEEYERVLEIASTEDSSGATALPAATDP